MLIDKADPTIQNTSESQGVKSDCTAKVYSRIKINYSLKHECIFKGYTLEHFGLINEIYK